MTDADKLADADIAITVKKMPDILARIEKMSPEEQVKINQFAEYR